MKVIQQGFEPEVQPQANGDVRVQVRAPAPQRARIRLQPFVAETRLFHAFKA